MKEAFFSPLFILYYNEQNKKKVLKNVKEGGIINKIFCINNLFFSMLSYLQYCSVLMNF